MPLPDRKNIEQVYGCPMSVYAVLRVHDIGYKRVVEAYASMII